MMRLPVPLRSFALTGAVLLAGALAAAAAAEGLDEMSMEELLGTRVTTASRFSQDRDDAPASLTVVTARDILDHGWRTVVEALASVPGLQSTFDRNYVSLGARGVALPGDYSNRIIVMVDGHRLNDPIYHGIVDIPVPIDLVDRIEVIRGPGSTLYGSDGLFAVINVITREGRGEAETTLRAAAGTQRSWETGVAHSSEHERWSVTAGAFSATSAGDPVVRSPGLPAIHDADGETASQVFVRLRRGRLTLMAASSSRRKDVPTAAYSTMPQAGTHTVDERSFVEALWRQELGKGTLSARLSLDEAEYSGHYLYDYSDSGDGSLLRTWRDASDGQWIRSEVDYDIAIGERLRFTTGVDLEHGLRASQRASAPGIGRVLDLEDAATTWGAHVQGQFRLAPRVSLIAGARWADMGPAGEAPSYRAALVIRPNPRTTLKLLHGTAFRGASAYERSYYRATRDRGSPSGEKITTNEVSLTRRWGQVELGVAAFHNTLENVITLHDSSEGLHHENHGSLIARGVEWTLDGSLRNGVRLRLHGAFQRATDESGQALVNSPRLRLHAGVVIPLGSPRSTLALEASWLGSRPTRSGKGSDATGLLALNWNHRNIGGVAGLDLTLRVTNALDSAAWTVAGEEHAPEVLPAPSRHVMLGLRYTF